MSQWVKVLVTKVNDLSLIPKIHCGREMRKEKICTTTIQCMPNILALRRQRQEDDS